MGLQSAFALPMLPRCRCGRRHRCRLSANAAAAAVALPPRCHTCAAAAAAATATASAAAATTSAGQLLPPSSSLCQCLHCHADVATIYVAIAVSVVPFLVDCCISPHTIAVVAIVFVTTLTIKFGTVFNTATALATTTALHSHCHCYCHCHCHRHCNRYHHCA